MLKRPAMRVSEPSGPILGLAAIFGVCLVLGLVIGGIWARFDQKGIRQEDYIVMVSLIYGRDADLRGAKERLALLEGDVTKQVLSLAESYTRSRPEAQAETRALGQLASALDPSAVTSRSAAEAGGRPAESSSPWMWWLGVALVLICVLGMGRPLLPKLVRAARGRSAGARLGQTSPRTSAGKWKDTPSRGSQPFALDLDEGNVDQEARPGPTHQSGPPKVAYASHPGSIQRSTTPNKQTQTRQAPERQVPVRQIPERQSPSRVTPSRSSAGTATFVCRYRNGLEPYDEVHPILSPLSGELIGACGMTGALKFSDSRDARYYAMSIWAQDYVSDEPLRCIGLISSHCKAHPPADLMRWAKSHVADEIVVANPGLKLSMDTSNLEIQVNVFAQRYGIDVRGPDDSFFSEMEVSFQVHVLSGALPR